MSQRDADRPWVTPVPSPDSDPSPQLLVSRQDTGPPVFTSVTRCLLQTSQLLGTWATRPSGTFGNDENVLFPALSSLAAAGHVEPPSRESSCDRELKPTLRLPATAARGRWLRGQTHNSRCHSSRADDADVKNIFLRHNFHKPTNKSTKSLNFLFFSKIYNF